MRTTRFICIPNVLYVYKIVCTKMFVYWYKMFMYASIFRVGGGGCLASYFINTILKISARINYPRI